MAVKLTVFPHLLGNYSETVACRWLKKHGLKLLQRNFRSRLGEIDLIMRHRLTIVFIEVRHRSSDKFGGALASVDSNKQQRIQRTAQYYLTKHNYSLQDTVIRFDVVATAPGPKGKPVVSQWIKNAFTG